MKEILKKCVRLWINYSKGYFNESDRANIIIGCAVLDEWLKVCILEFHSDKKKVIKKFIESPGAISSFGSRIDYFYLIGHIPEDIHWALHKVRELRNVMAHKSIELNFESGSIRDKIKVIEDILQSDKEAENAKQKFHGIITKLFFSMSYNFLETIGIPKDRVIAEWQSVHDEINKSS